MRLTTSVYFLMGVFAGCGVLRAIAMPTVFPTGTTIYNPTKAYPCYVLFSAPDGKTHLIDLDGNSIHEWPYPGFPSDLLSPEITGGKKGHVLVQLENGDGDWGGIFNNKTIAELDWEGNVAWQWGKEAPGGAVSQNHDIARLSNGNTLLIATIKHKIPALSSIKDIEDQAIYEVNPKGEIVWKWLASDHLDEFGLTATGRAYLKRNLNEGVGVSTGFLTINDMKPVGPNHWFESGDLRFNPDNIIFDSREGNFIGIINKKSSKLVWRLGPDYPEDLANRRLLDDHVPRQIDQISGQHDVQIIPEGLPGAGNLLVFDNQGEGGFPPATLGMFSASRVIEVDPVKKLILWQYTSTESDRPVWAFSSSFISSARRLPNGNTLIDEGMTGRFFQVTPKGEVVWEYLNPYFGELKFRGHNAYTNWCYRAEPVPFSWVPDGTPHSEAAVVPPDITTFRVPGSAAK